MLKGIAVELRGSRWHKAHMRKLLKRKLAQKNHTNEYRMLSKTGVQMSEAEKKYREALEREAQTIVSKNWFIRQLIKLKLYFKHLWQKLNLKK